jgi:hypothetical protein
MSKVTISFECSPDRASTLIAFDDLLDRPIDGDGDDWAVVTHDEFPHIFETVLDRLPDHVKYMIDSAGDIESEEALLPRWRAVLAIARRYRNGEL